jgi:hypothetical protein
MKGQSLAALLSMGTYCRENVKNTIIVRKVLKIELGTPWNKVRRDTKNVNVMLDIPVNNCL